MKHRLQTWNIWTRFRHILSIPFIWGVLIPVVLFDLVLELYHQVCFPLYRIEKVKRSSYIRIDRQHLSYLSTIDKINCMYCGYVNGWLAYATQIAGRTELYWCAIKHNNASGDFHEPEHHAGFAKYNDEDDLEKKFPKS